MVRSHAVVALLLLLVAIVNCKVYDVCVIGGGSSGSAATVFLQDNGHDVLLLESSNRLGGHCNTYYTPGKGFGLVEEGVQTFTDTAFANATGRGTWALDSRKYAQRWVPAQAIVDVSYATSTQAVYLADWNAGFTLPPPTPEQLLESEVAFGVALESLYGFVLQYPWLNTGVIPDPLPPVFLRPFTELVVNRSLQALQIEIFDILLYGNGVAPEDSLTVLEALLTLSASTLDLYNPATPASAFAIGTGCQSMYNAIQAHIGAHNIIFNANITDILRPKEPCSERPISVMGNIAGSVPTSHFEYRCKSIVTAFYPLIENLGAFQLTREEEELFRELSAHYYFDAAVSFVPTALTNQSFTIINVNVSNQPTMELNYPSTSMIVCPAAGGLAGSWANSAGPITKAQMLSVMQSDLAKIPAVLLTNATVVDSHLHRYSPHWSINSLKASPNAATRFNRLQGKLNTIWVGAAASRESSPSIWDRTFRYISAFFPKKK